MNQTSMTPTALGGAALMGLGDLVRRFAEDGASTPTRIVAAFHAHQALALTAGFCMLAGSALLLLAVAASVRAAASRPRGRTLVRIGGALFWVGMVASIGHVVAYFGLDLVWGRAEVGSSTVAVLDKASEAEPLLVTLIILFVLGLTLGQLLWVGGLVRARVVPAWALLAALVDVVAGNTAGVAGGVVSLLAWTAVGVAVAGVVRPRAAAEVTASTAVPASA